MVFLFVRHCFLLIMGLDVQYWSRYKTTELKLHIFDFFKFSNQFPLGSRTWQCTHWMPWSTRKLLLHRSSSFRYLVHNAVTVLFLWTIKLHIFFTLATVSVLDGCWIPCTTYSHPSLRFSFKLACITTGFLDASKLVSFTCFWNTIFSWMVRFRGISTKFLPYKLSMMKSFLVSSCKNCPLGSCRINGTTL